MPFHACWTDLIKLFLGEFSCPQIPLLKGELDILLGLSIGLQVWSVLTGLLVSVTAWWTFYALANFTLVT